MRSITLVAVALSALALSAPAASATPPTLKIGMSTNLSVVGSGFKPRVLVTLRVVFPGVTRTAQVRTSRQGAFTFQFIGIERCAPDLVTARTATGSGARVSPVWFVRECPPPPPLQPGTPPAQPAAAAAA